MQGALRRAGRIGTLADCVWLCIVNQRGWGLPKPSFICIGTQKAATTWLTVCLRAHPDVWIPPIKELHYFDLRESADYPRHRVWQLAERMHGWLDRNILPLHDLAWTRPYVLAPKIDDAWYLSLFDEAADRMAGELTPNYCGLDADQFAAMHNLLPDSKLIFLMREPLARTWSGYLTYCRYMGFDVAQEIATGRYRDDLIRDGALCLARYALILQRIESLWPKAQLFYGFYEDITRRPEGFLRDLLSFLGLPWHANLKNLIGAHIHVSPSISPPADVYPLLAPYFLSSLRDLAVRFPQPAAMWLETCEAHASA